MKSLLNFCFVFFKLHTGTFIDDWIQFSYPCNCCVARCLINIISCSIVIY